MLRSAIVGTIAFVVANNAWAQCVVDGTQEVESETVPYRVVYNDETVNRKAVYTAKVYIKRCEIGSASNSDDRFCTWKHDVYVERMIYQIVRGAAAPALLPDRTKRIDVSSTDHQPEASVRFDGAEKNCQSQRGNAERVDEEKRQLARSSLANVISADHNSIEQQESSESGFKRVEW